MNAHACHDNYRQGVFVRSCVFNPESIGALHTVKLNSLAN